jgi:hypothetical protein
MASFKFSEFAGVANTTDDSLLLLSYTTDNGSSYETRKIRIADFLDDIAEDPNLASVITLTGMPAGSENLGSFTGSTISDNLTIKAALQSLETAVEGKQGSITGGDGIDITTDVISVDLADSPNSFLEFDTGKLKASVLDEDDMSSNSASHLATQQSIKAYVDSTNLAQDSTIDSTYVRVDGTNAFTGNQSMGGNRLTSLGTPQVSNDAATKAYVDSATSGQGAFWQTVRVESHGNGNIDLAVGGLLTVDGITLVAGDRVLVQNQTDDTENGIYVAATGAWTRSADADESSEFTVNKTVYISEGSTGAGSVHAYVGVDNPTLGSDSLVFLKKQESANVADGSITTIKLADGAVTDVKVSDVAATKLTGTLNDATVAETNVTQHQGALSLDASQIVSGTFADTRISETSVTQHQAALSITESQISDLGNYATNTTVNEIDVNVDALITLSGMPEESTSLGTFTGDTISDSATVKSALQELETAIEGLASTDLSDSADLVRSGDNINTLVGSTGADGEPTNYLFLVVDQLDGSIKAIDKTFIEIE